MIAYLFTHNPTSCRKIASDLGLEWAHLCYAKRHLEKEGVIRSYRRIICPISGRWVQCIELSHPEARQLSLW